MDRTQLMHREDLGDKVVKGLLSTLSPVKVQTGTISKQITHNSLTLVVTSKTMKMRQMQLKRIQETIELKQDIL